MSPIASGSFLSGVVPYRRIGGTWPRKVPTMPTRRPAWLLTTLNWHRGTKSVVPSISLATGIPQRPADGERTSD